VFVLLDSVDYTRNSYINRVKIRTDRGVQWITLPVGRISPGTPIKEVMVSDYSWKDRLWKTIRQNYRKAPYWRDYSPELQVLLENRDRWLLDINLALLFWLMDKLDVRAKLCIQSSFKEEGEKGSDRLAWLCCKHGCDRYLSGVGAQEYLDVAPFNRNGVEVVWQEFEHPTYRQVFEPFIPGLSALDAVLNLGEEAKGLFA